MGFDFSNIAGAFSDGMDSLTGKKGLDTAAQGARDAQAQAKALAELQWQRQMQGLQEARGQTQPYLSLYDKIYGTQMAGRMAPVGGLGAGTGGTGGLGGADQGGGGQRPRFGAAGPAPISAPPTRGGPPAPGTPPPPAATMGPPRPGFGAANTSGTSSGGGINLDALLAQLRGIRGPF